MVLPEILEARLEETRQMIRDESALPMQHVRLYDKYAALVSRQAEEDVEQFLREKHSFHDTMMEVTRYQKLADDIQYNSAKVPPRTPLSLSPWPLHCPPGERGIRLNVTPPQSEGCR